MNDNDPLAKRYRLTSRSRTAEHWITCEAPGCGKRIYADRRSAKGGDEGAPAEQGGGSRTKAIRQNPWKGDDTP